MGNNMDGKSSFRCPGCKETLTYSNNLLNFIDYLDIQCPLCGMGFKGHDRLPAESVEKVEEAPVVVPPYPLVARLMVMENFSDDECNTRCEEGEIYDIEKDCSVIGRKDVGNNADIQIPTNLIMSRRHIVVTRAGNCYALRCADPMPKNPTLVNGKQVAEGESVILSNGDLITLGNTVLMWKQERPKGTKVIFF